MLDLDAWFADPFNYQPPEEPEEVDMTGVIGPLRPCSIDHDHDRSWWCENGFSGTLKLDNMRRDAVDLIDAVRELTEVLKVKPS